MIAIAGGKGGCGKTTTTLATARALAAAGVDARAVDLDAGMPNLHRMADVDRDPSLTDLVGTTEREHQEQRERETKLTRRIQRDANGVEIVPAPRALENVDVPAALDAIEPAAGIALLDCPAGAGPAATAPLREADAAIVVTTGRRESTEDAAKTVRMARTLGVPVLGVIVTRTERVSTAVQTTLGIDQVIAVPHSGDPLADDRVAERYQRVAGAIRSWLDRGGPTSADAERSRDTRRDRAKGSDDRAVTSECPHCGNRRTERSDRNQLDRRGRRATDRRDRRSPRSRDREGRRSSSRGGGALSDRR